MTNPEKLKQATELLAARGEGFDDGLRWAQKLIEEEKNDDYIGAEKHLPSTGGVIWTILEPICFYNSLQAKIKAKLGEV